ncbi:hypothetical protein [Actinomadura chibensis]|uniref:Uncharacterized protein n=1 Tax=Actinomadura chibensis TaxID=392828 RepID=A0A5D0N8U4_9ACTN|nr:hypothetical protein [Actinomadura chibensis]TYB40833.1 hypothetical protein FXF69_38110 [Actinomadura chibensis]
MASKPLAEVRLVDLATKEDLQHLATKDDVAELRQEVGDVKQELGSAVNLLMGEIGKIAARQEEMAGHVARLVARSEGVKH